MAPLLYHRQSIVSDGATPGQYIRLNNLGHCRIRIINMMDGRNACQMSCMIINKNQATPTPESISIFSRQQSIGGAYDVGWEGDIELGADQDLVAQFMDDYIVATATFVPPAAADDLYITVGYEVL